MKLVVKNTFFVLFFILAAVNIYIFVSSMYLGDNINRFSGEIERLTLENNKLEKEVVQAESLQYASSLSAQLNFTKKSEPVYFESLKYALAR